MADFAIIAEQLKENCPCASKTWRDQALFQRVVEDLINLVSIATCWQQKPCETFLLSEREEYFDLGDYAACGCDAGMITIEPFYHPIELGSIKITLLELEGTKVTEYELTEDDFVYNAAWGNTIKVNVGSYVRNGDCCCPLQYKLRVTYYAGYSQIPDCLLPIFCGLLQTVYDKNNCTCGKCDACKAQYDADTEIEYPEDDTISKLIDNYYNSVVLAAFKKQLGLISICRQPQEFSVWGVVAQ